MRIIHFFESIIRLSSLIVISTLTVVSVVSLNPSLVDQTDASIAGITTEDSATNSIIGVIPRFSDEYLVSTFDDSYTIRLDSLPATTSIDAFKLTNFSNDEGKKRVEAHIKESLIDDVKVELVDEYDRIILTSPSLGLNQRSITVDAQSQREFSLVISSEIPINFPLEIIITIL